MRYLPKTLTASRTRDHFTVCRAAQFLFGCGHRSIAAAGTLATPLFISRRHGRLLQLFLLLLLRLLLWIFWQRRLLLWRCLLTSLAGIGILLERLQLGQRYNVTLARPMPYGLLRGRIVVIEALRIRIKQFPPLRWVGALNWHILKRKRNESWANHST